MSVVQRHLAVRAKDWQRATETTLNDVHILLHAYASRPQGLAAPFVFRVMDLIREAEFS